MTNRVLLAIKLASRLATQEAGGIKYDNLAPGKEKSVLASLLIEHLIIL
jgi:hypothetical protein